MITRINKDTNPWEYGDHKDCRKGYVIRNGPLGTPGIMATIYAVYPRNGAGTLHVAMGSRNPETEEFEWFKGRAGGFGYDKLTAALTNMKVCGHELGKHCDSKGRPTVEVLCQQKGWLYLEP